MATSPYEEEPGFQEINQCYFSPSAVSCILLQPSSKKIKPKHLPVFPGSSGGCGVCGQCWGQDAANSRDLATYINLHIPITTLTTHNTFGTRRDAKAQVGAAVVKIFVTRQRPALVVPWQSGAQTAHFAPSACDAVSTCFHYVTPWPGTLADVVIWQGRHWWERCQLFSFALWGLSRLRVRDDSLCDLADCFCISMEICLLVDPEDACWETNWCEIEHVFSFLSFSLYLALSLSVFSLSLDSRNSAGWVHQWQWDLYSAAWRSAGRPCWADSSQHSQMWHVWHVTCCILLWTPSDVPHPKVSKLSKPVLALFNYHTSCGRQMWPSSEWKVTIDRNKPHPPKAIPLHLGWSLCVVSCRIFWTCDENPRMPGWSYGWKRWPRPFGVQDPGQLSYTATQNHVVFLCFSYEQIIYHIP